MSTRFLHGDGILVAICEANARHAKRSLGVASWGADAVERLCLGDDLGDTKIICDLWSEGCEPEAIIALLKGGAKIRHVEGFQAKTYIYVDRVIIGRFMWSSQQLSEGSYDGGSAAFGSSSTG